MSACSARRRADAGIGIPTTAAAVLAPMLLGSSAGPEGERFAITAAFVVPSGIVSIASIANEKLDRTPRPAGS